MEAGAIEGWRRSLAMARIDRKAAIDDYKKRKVPAGIYLLTHTGTSGRWIGHAADLDQIMNRIFFTLRMGSHRSAFLQAAWNEGGDDGLAFRRLETFEADGAPEGEALKARLAEWCSRLDAEPL
jgi:hypothetical protein